MHSIIDILKKEKNAITQKLSSSQEDKKSLLHKSKQLDTLIGMINFFESNSIEITDYYPIIIKDMATGYSEFRIMNDCESDNPALWMEYPLRLNGLDVVFKRKQ